MGVEGMVEDAGEGASILATGWFGVGVVRGEAMAVFVDSVGAGGVSATSDFDGVPGDEVYGGGGPSASASASFFSFTLDSFFSLSPSTLTTAVAHHT